jgi:hypothetical protein
MDRSISPSLTHAGSRKRCEVILAASDGITWIVILRSGTELTAIWKDTNVPMSAIEAAIRCLKL